MEVPTDLPPATRPAASIAYAANPTPNHAANFNHPPYAEMITAAIVAMKEKDGSSRQAIAKYIENEYTSLSPSHSSLLTQQLKRMKNNGQLVMVKHSYLLPISGSGSGQNSDGPKRRPGRPPKARPEIQPNDGGTVDVSPRVDGPPATFGQNSGLATTAQASGPDTGVPTFDPIGAAPTMVPIGQVDGPVKRRPGRPPKASSVVVDAEPVRSVVPLSTVGKRRPGRPLRVSNVLVGVGLAVPTLGKRSRGRPKLLSVLMGNGASKRGRGRPPRVGRPGIGQTARGRPKKVAAGRPRGRPPKNVAVNGGGAGLVAVNGTGDGVLPVKRAGRLPETGEVKKPRKLGGKPLGRPKKNASVAAIQASEQQQQLIAYQELKGRVEHFQSRIKQAVSVVKPYLNNETAVIAVGALQELDELASMDIITQVTVQSAPVTVQSAPVMGTGQSAPVAVQSQSVSVNVQNAPWYVQAASGYVQSAPGYVQSAPESVQNAPLSFQGQEHFFQN